MGGVGSSTAPCTSSSTRLALPHRLDMNEQLRATAAVQGGAFTSAQARKCGLTDERLGALVSVGAIRRLRRGVFAETSTVQDSADLHAANAGAATLSMNRR